MTRRAPPRSRWIAGQATLAGSLTASLDGGYTPAAGDRFRIMTFASHAGTFASQALPADLAVESFADGVDVVVEAP